MSDSRLLGLGVTFPILRASLVLILALAAGATVAVVSALIPMAIRLDPNSLRPVLLGGVALIVVVVGGVLAARGWRMDPIALALMASLVSVPAGRLLVPGLMVFSYDGLIRTITVPAVALIMLAAAARRINSGVGQLHALDYAWCLIFLSTLISFGVAVLSNHELIAVVQDLGVAAVFLLSYAVGRLGRESLTPTRMRQTLLILVAASIAVYLIGIAPAPFTSFGVAAAATLVFMPNDRHRPLAVVAGGMLILLSALTAHRSADQVATLAAFALGFLWLFRRHVLLRKFLLGVSFVILVVGSTASDVGSTFAGTYSGRDATLAQRAYEGDLVVTTVSRSWGSTLLGEGLGPSVNLLGSPDEDTIAAARGGAGDVSDVHLLQYDILLKRGILGLIAFGAFLGALVVQVWRELTSKHDHYGFLLIALIVLALPDAFTASSHFWSNPVLPFAAGLLVVRRLGDRERPDRLTAESGRGFE